MGNLNRRSALQRVGLGLLGSGALSRLDSQAAQRQGSKTDDCNCSLAADGSPLDTGTSEIRPAIERYEVELRNLNRVYALPGSALRQAKLEKFYADQLQLLEKSSLTASASPARSITCCSAKGSCANNASLPVKRGRTPKSGTDSVSATIIGFEESRRRMETVDPRNPPSRW